MTTDPAEMTASERAALILRKLISPLVPNDPAGVRIVAKDRTLVVSASTRNIGALIGRNGSMCASFRGLMEPLGWNVQINSAATLQAKSPPPDGQVDYEAVCAMVVTWLDARYGREAYSLDGQASSEDYTMQEWTVFVHPDQFRESDHTALENWAYGAARAQGGFLKIRLKPGGKAYLKDAGHVAA